jgi:hypothetical protein
MSDVFEADRLLSVSSVRMGTAIGESYPKISTVGLLRFESLNTQRLFKQATFQSEATAGLRWRLFDIIPAL